MKFFDRVENSVKNRKCLLPAFFCCSHSFFKRLCSVLLKLGVMSQQVKSKYTGYTSCKNYTSTLVAKDFYTTCQTKLLFVWRFTPYQQHFSILPILKSLVYCGQGPLGHSGGQIKSPTGFEWIGTLCWCVAWWVFKSIGVWTDLFMCLPVHELLKEG